MRPQEQIEEIFVKYGFADDTMANLSCFLAAKKRYMADKNDIEAYGEMTFRFQLLDSELKLGQVTGIYDNETFLRLRELLREGVS